jgi:integrase
MRAGEIIALRWADVDQDARRVHVRRSRTRGVTKSTKSGRHRSIPLTADLLADLEALREVDGERERDHLVFHRGGAELRIGNLLECLWRTLRATRTDPKDAGTGLRRVRFHDLRHSFASNLVSAGVPIVQVQHWLGHSTVSTTEIYAHLAPSDGQHHIEALAGVRFLAAA